MTQVKGMVNSTVTDFYDKLYRTTKSIKFDLTEVCNVARERHEIIVKSLYEFKKFVEINIKEVYELLSTVVKKNDGLFLGVQKNVDCLLVATRTLVEDVRAFNVRYKEALEKKKEDDDTLFKGIDTSINTFQERILNVATDSRSLLFDVHVNKSISLIEACFKS